jgi:hypothetical protein
MVIPQDSRAAALAPAAVALTLLVVMVQIRMDGPWSEGVLVLMCALLLAGLTIARLGHALAGHDYLDGGGTFSWMLALVTALSGFVYSRTRAVVAVLGSSAPRTSTCSASCWRWRSPRCSPPAWRRPGGSRRLVHQLEHQRDRRQRGDPLVAAAGIVAVSGFYVIGLGLLFGATAGLGWGGS